MDNLPGTHKQFSTVLCPSCGLVWQMDRLAPAPCPECHETHVIFRGTTYMIPGAAPAVTALAS